MSIHTHIYTGTHARTHHGFALLWKTCIQAGPYYVAGPATAFPPSLRAPSVFSHRDQDKCTTIYLTWAVSECSSLQTTLLWTRPWTQAYLHRMSICKTATSGGFFFPFWKILPKWHQFIEPVTFSTVNLHNSCTRLQGKNKHLSVVLSCLVLMTSMRTDIFSCLGSPGVPSTGIVLSTVQSFLCAFLILWVYLSVSF